jgi:uncharacterized membrane protein
MPILNWYLYTYGLVTASLFAAARLLAPPRDRVFGSNAPALLYTLGTILAFLLVNIEIADSFALRGERPLTFRFSGNLGMEMTYSIAWALFALVMLIVGFTRRLPVVRYVAIALLGITLIKVFAYDLRHLRQLFRVGALIGVAIIAIVASFLYQRFSAATARSNEHPNPPKV